MWVLKKKKDGSGFGGGTLQAVRIPCISAGLSTFITLARFDSLSLSGIPVRL